MVLPPVDRTAPPPAGEVRGFGFPPFVKQVLPGGLTVLASRVAGVPLVSLGLVTRAGSENNPPEQAGLSTFTSALLDEGTPRRDSLEIASWVERLGGYLYTAADWDAGYIGINLLAQHLRAGLALLAEIALTPTFPEREIERIRRLRQADLLRRAYDPSPLAEDRLAQVLYQGTPYAFPILGRASTLATLDRAAVQSFYEQRYSLAGSTMVAVGDIDPETVIRQIEEALVPDPARPPAPPGPVIQPTPLDGIAVHIVDRPGSSQTELRLGHAGVGRRHPDILPLNVLNMLLGGKFTSRINLNLRERHGYTYGASSRFHSRRGPGPFQVDAAVATESVGAAAREILWELRRIREERVEPREMEETLSYMMGIYSYTLQTISDVTKRLEALAIYDLPDDHYATYPRRLAAVDRERLLEVARRHLDPEHIAIVAVGPAETLAPQLEELGPVTVHPRETPEEAAAAG